MKKQYKLIETRKVNYFWLDFLFYVLLFSVAISGIYCLGLVIFEDDIYFTPNLPTWLVFITVVIFFSAIISNLTREEEIIEVTRDITLEEKNEKN